MKLLRTLPLIILMLAFFGAAQCAVAQDAPKVSKFDLFGGYAYMLGNVVVSGQGISMNGASGSLAYNHNRWLGFVADIGFYHQGNVAGNGFTLTISSYQFGPRLSWRKNERFSPFGQFLVGVGHASGTLYTTSLGAGLTPLGTQNSFAFAGGGGMDWNVNPKIAVRVFQAEYLHTQFANRVSNQQNNFRFSAGVVFHFGKH